MKLAIITHVPHLKYRQELYAYGPYVREMNLWIKNADKVLVVAPLAEQSPNAIHFAYNHSDLNLIPISSFNIKTFSSVFNALLKLPVILFSIFRAMKEADHIHLRCPGNIGLLACFVQIFFPNKPKTAKYAGNWDPKAKQPISYKLQKWILSNTFLTKNMQVLVYGEWPHQTQNIKPFFTATYSEVDKAPIKERNLNEKIQFLFVGTLSIGKQPLYAIKLVEKIFNAGYSVQLRLYGEGEERKNLEEYIAQQALENSVFLMGNQTKEQVQLAYQESHFLILPSKSEGWPKVVAEAMFWGCVPVSSRVSCVPTMLNNEERGILLTMDLDADFEKLKVHIDGQDIYINKSNEAWQWSRIYTVDYFDEEIQKLLKG